jgi:hypothetical protein
VTGATGTKGATGATGATGSVAAVELSEKSTTIAYGAAGTVEATCKGAGEVAISGGFTFSAVGTVPYLSERTSTGNGWKVEFDNESNGEVNSIVTVLAYCIK